tara:strand:+ start:153 stop:560 length:408 start_codon:yes stop_codon:yes gene_type:complete
MTDKSTILKAFNNHFFEFFDDLINIVEDNTDIKSSKKFLSLTKMANASLIIKIWYQFISTPYKSYFESGDLDYFANKDYSEDLSQLANAKDTLKALDKFRVPLKSLDQSNKEKCLEYLKNLCKLSDLYDGLSKKY